MEREAKKLERRAKALLLRKSIPPVKMDIVRSLMQSESILPEEKYNTIIDLIQSCPDKPVKVLRREKVELREPQRVETTIPSETEIAEKKRSIEPTDTSLYVDRLYRKYRRLKFFKRRYIIHANNRFGFGFKKRLIPSKRLMKVLRELSDHQEKIASRLSLILIEILNDESIQDATAFNYLRVFRRWIMDTPLIRYNLDIIKWMDRSDFESELRSYTVGFFSFRLLDSETREQILLMAENKVRILDDFKKEIVNEKDSEQLKRAKEKRNLAREKLIYEYMMNLRVFMSSVTDSNDSVSRYLNTNYSIESLSQFLLIILEALVFKREIEADKIIAYYEITSPVVSSEVWDYSLDYLKKIGKDPESRRKRYINELKNQLAPLEELYLLLKFTPSGSNLLQSAFEYQWKHVDKKKSDYESIYKDDFFSFIYGCLNFFNNSYISFIVDSVIYFYDRNKNHLEGSVFNSSYFEKEVVLINEILEEIYFFKSNNPNLTISRGEALRIINGEIRSMSNIATILRRIGSLFYQIGWEMHGLFSSHKKWLMHDGKLRDVEDIRTPRKRGEYEFYEETGRPLPFYDCTIKGFQNGTALSNLHKGKGLVSNGIGEGIFVEIIAFCYQIAYECKDDEILNDLSERKDLLRRIKELAGKKR